MLKALRGNTGPRGPQGIQGAKGNQGVAGSARAWGHITPAGNLSVSPVGISGVTHPATGVYCIAVPGAFAGVDVAFVGADYTFDTTGTGSPGEATIVEVASATGGCPVGQFEIHTYRNANGGVGGVQSYDESFYFMVP